MMFNTVFSNKLSTTLPNSGNLERQNKKKCTLDYLYIKYGFSIYLNTDTIMCLNIGSPNTINFLFERNGKFMGLCVPNEKLMVLCVTNVK